MASVLWMGAEGKELSLLIKMLSSFFGSTELNYDVLVLVYTEMTRAEQI